MIYLLCFVEIQNDGITRVTYVHCALGRRSKKTLETTNTVRIYDLSGNLIAERDATEAHNEWPDVGYRLV